MGGGGIFIFSLKANPSHPEKEGFLWQMVGDADAQLILSTGGQIPEPCLRLQHLGAGLSVTFRAKVSGMRLLLWMTRVV